ncbi:S-layer homology domain-containing protein [Cohnella sp. AR92]|uniref:S-layer homology domain-containing protein n=1 Tax=Cohnella sp. AR92 TaxID=648716 RepID=UPI000FB7D6CB|nr:S-layer homology domain-containing protein [Cohnella sp. AR92]RUS48962.1 S-layer homology domain-containing protein [Cohnella sp. AR92]
MRISVLAASLLIYACPLVSAEGDSENGQLPRFELVPEKPLYPDPEADPSGKATLLVNGSAGLEGSLAVTTVKRGGRDVLAIALDQAKLEPQLEEAGMEEKAVIRVKAPSAAAYIELNGSLFERLSEKRATVVLGTANASFSVPLEAINANRLLESFGDGATLSDFKLQIETVPIRKDQEERMEQASLREQSGILMPMDFSVRAVLGDREAEIDRFDSYVEFSIAIPRGLYPEFAKSAIMLGSDSSIAPVPTKLSISDDSNWANIRSLSSGLYGIVSFAAPFSDAELHWAKEAIEDLGSRRILAGDEQGLFHPGQEITRAEFAAILARALGLPAEANGTGSETARFSDVPAAAWYGEFIRSANAYGLIDGYEDGTFRPMEKLTREQAMTILARAMRLTGVADKLKPPSAEWIASFADGSKISAWAREGVTDSLQAGLIAGRSGGKLAPQDALTRAEAATIIRNLLRLSGFIDNIGNF